MQKYQESGKGQESNTQTHNMALNSNTITSKLDWECFERLNNLAKEKRVALRWVAWCVATRQLRYKQKGGHIICGIGAILWLQIRFQRQGWGTAQSIPLENLFGLSIPRYSSEISTSKSKDHDKTPHRNRKKPCHLLGKNVIDEDKKCLFWSPSNYNCSLKLLD